MSIASEPNFPTIRLLSAVSAGLGMDFSKTMGPVEFERQEKPAGGQKASERNKNFFMANNKKYKRNIQVNPTL